MAQFVSIHRAPGLSPDEMAENALPVFNHGTATYIQNYVNLGSGFIVTVFDAESKEALEEAFEELGFPVDEIHEVQFAQSRDELEGMLKGMGKL